MLTGLNHITLAVADLERSLVFYTDLLGFRGEVRWRKGAYLSLESLWLCLSVDSPSPTDDYSHVAFSVSQTDFPILSRRLQDAGVEHWKTNLSEGDSFYFRDPDGHKLEIHVGDLTTRLQSLKQHPYDQLEWLNR